MTRAKRDPTFRGSERYPPGIDEFGLVDPHALWGAHQFYLRDRSFTLVRSGDDRWSQLPPAGTVAVENATTYLVTRRGRDTLYGDPSGTYYRAADARANATEGDDVVEGDRDRYRLLMTREHGARWLTMHESHVSRVERNGTTLFRLVVTHPPDGAPVAPEHFNAVFLVRKSGLIEEIRLDLRVRVSAAGLDPDDDRVWTDVTYRYEYRAVGSTTVSEPAWVRATKRNRTATAADSRSAGPPTAGRPAPRETGSPPPREGFLSGLS